MISFALIAIEFGHEIGSWAAVVEFQGMPKIGRWNRETIVSEKIDGTSGLVFIPDLLSDIENEPEFFGAPFLVGSRNRWITPSLDNHGFARWCEEHKDDLLTLGPGKHFGEWFGAGIQRGYGLKDKRFSLFNVLRWGEDRDLKKYPLPPPSCCSVVPLLWRGPIRELNVDFLCQVLRDRGSYAVEGYMNPEGIVIFHTATGTLAKVTLENDDTPKSLVQ